MTKELVLVTGADGYIANHVVQQLQQAGYRVRGTIQNLKNKDSVKELMNLYPNAKYPLELVEADLMHPNSWKAAVAECTYVIHMASPVPIKQPKNEDDVIQPAVQGTLNVLKACRDAVSVKRVIMTSSVAAIGEIEKTHYDESDWADLNSKHINAYRKSKILAERAAWDYIKEIKADGCDDLELATIQPVFVIGPVLCGPVRSTLTMTKYLMERKVLMIPKLNYACVDVRDVAMAHIKAMTSAGAANNRHIISGENIFIPALCKIIDQEFKTQGYKIPTKTATYFVMWIMGKFVASVKYLVPSIGKVCIYSNNRMKLVLGIHPRAIKDTILDMCYSMVETGNVKRTKDYTGPRYSTD